MPPEMANHTPVGRDQQSSVGYSDTNLSRKPREARKATKADAKQHQIPDRYNLKQWDPDEKPIFLAGSVFDSNSLGKYIYDWTVDKHGRGGAFKGIAGDLWELLIWFYGSIKRTEEFIDINDRSISQELDEDLDSAEQLESNGKYLRKKLDGLLMKGEEAMLKTGSKNGGRLGRKAAHALVDALFGRDQLMKETEELMQMIRKWMHDWEVWSDRVRRRSDR